MTDAIKIIESQQIFAKNVYLDFMSRRFGITPCCIKDPISAKIKKELCDWNSLKKDIPSIQKIFTEIFYPSSPINPCDDPLAPEWCKECGYFEPENAQEILAELEDLYNTLKELCTQKDLLQAEIQFLEEQYANLIAKIEQAQIQIEDLQETLNTLELQAKALEQELQDVCADPSQEEKCQELTLELKDLQVLIAKIKTEIDVYEQTISEVEEAALNIQSQIEGGKEELADLEAKIAEKLEMISKLEALFCDDSECITIKVIDQHGDPVENYEIIIDGGNTGFTDHHGMFYHVIPNASIDTDHTLQVCYCFDTEGICRQQHITITIDTGKDKEDCTPSKSCEEVKIEKTIIGTPPSCDNLPETDNQQNKA